MTYTINNTRGTVVTTVTDLTVNTATPLTLVGAGLSGYGQTIETDLFYLLENFCNSTAPTNPPLGMTWYDNTSGSESLRIWDGTIWERVASANAGSALLDRMTGASSLSFASTGSTSIYTGPTGKRSFITGILVVPQNPTSISNSNPPPAFHLEVTSNSSDVMDKVVLTNLYNNTHYAYYNIQGVTRIIQPADVLKIVIDTAITAGDTFVCDVYAFGVVRT